MHPEDIKASLRKAGSSPAAISRDKSVTKMAVTHVIHGNSKSARIAKAISEAIGVPVSKVWPGKYPGLEIAERLGMSAERATTDLIKHVKVKQSTRKGAAA